MKETTTDKRVRPCCRWAISPESLCRRARGLAPMCRLKKLGSALPLSAPSGPCSSMHRRAEVIKHSLAHGWGDSEACDWLSCWRGPSKFEAGLAQSSGLSWSCPVSTGWVTCPMGTRVFIRVPCSFTLVYGATTDPDIYFWCHLDEKKWKKPHSQVLKIVSHYEVIKTQSIT